MKGNTQSLIQTIDHRHDVLVGSIVGLLLSFFAYHQYYPSLTSPNSHLPFSPCIHSWESGGHSHAPSTNGVQGGHMDHVPDLERGGDHDTRNHLPERAEPVPLDEIGGW